MYAEVNPPKSQKKKPSNKLADKDLICLEKKTIMLAVHYVQTTTKKVWKREKPATHYSSLFANNDKTTCEKNWVLRNTTKTHLHTIFIIDSSFCEFFYYSEKVLSIHHGDCLTQRFVKKFFTIHTRIIFYTSVFPDDFFKNPYEHCRKNQYRLKKFRTVFRHGHQIKGFCK